MRLRKQKDKARIAFPAYGDAWFVVNTIDGECYLMDNAAVESDDWVELYVAELPAPDGRVLNWNNEYPFWFIDEESGIRVESDGEGLELTNAGARYDLDDIEREALIMLAAVRSVRREQNED